MNELPEALRLLDLVLRSEDQDDASRAHAAKLLWEHGYTAYAFTECDDCEHELRYHDSRIRKVGSPPCSDCSECARKAEAS